MQYNFSGNIPNPIVDARIQVSMSSSNALAKRLGLSRQYIKRAEQGTYASLNPALLKWTANALLIGTGDVTKRYVQFQKAVRAKTVRELEPHRLERTDGNNELGHIIFERWRSGYWPSVVAFSNAFCLHADTIGNYEAGLRKAMPSSIRDALIEVNLMDRDFEEFGPDPVKPYARS